MRCHCMSMVLVMSSVNLDDVSFFRSHSINLEKVKLKRYIN